MTPLPPDSRIEHPDADDEYARCERCSRKLFLPDHPTLCTGCLHKRRRYGLVSWIVQFFSASLKLFQSREQK